MELRYKTDSEPLNRLQTLIRVNVHLMSEDDAKAFNEVYKELVGEYQQYENEVLFNETLIEENERLKSLTHESYITAKVK